MNAAHRILRRGVGRHDAEERKPLPQIGMLEALHRFAIETLDDCPRRTCRREQAENRRHLHTGQSRFARGRDVGQRGEALRGQYRN